MHSHAGMPARAARLQTSCGINGSRLLSDATFYASLGTHQVGYPGHTAVRDWLLRRLQQLSISADKEDFELPGSQFLNESCSLAMRNGSTHRCRALWLPRAGRVVPGNGSQIEIIMHSGSIINLEPSVTAEIVAATARGAAAVIIVLRHHSGARQLNVHYTKTMQSQHWPVRASPLPHHTHCVPLHVHTHLAAK